MHSLSVILLIGFTTAYGLPSTHIVGGRDAPIGKYPYQVSLRLNGRHFCGGSIINNRHILTAAHCLQAISSVKDVVVHAGTNLLNETGVPYKVQSFVGHSGFDFINLRNDVGLIRVSTNIVYNNKVQPILINSGNSTLDGAPCVLSGWGATSLGSPIPNKLQEINLLVESQAKCKATHKGLHESHICTYTRYGQGACHGDSGSPLVAYGVQIGIVSFGRPCAVGAPDVYTRVSSFTNWIRWNQMKLDAQSAEGE